ncbi:MAG: energy transducer TonB [Treponema sp.]|jgi:protein TonB|nr:energy transducer TonB [Treponema sp.]
MRNSIATTRFITFVLTALLHGALILFLAVRVNTALQETEEPIPVMKVLDLAEDEPPPPPPPPEPPPDNPNAVESIAENMIETEQVPEEQILVAPGTLTVSRAPSAAEGEIEYLSMGKISATPVFSEREILRSLVYPPIARRSGIEGMVYLELFIDSRGEIRRVEILKEEPANRGFGEAAIAAFRNVTCKPAEANGVAVAVRYRYPVRFKLRD